MDEKQSNLKTMKEPLEIRILKTDESHYQFDMWGRPKDVAEMILSVMFENEMFAEMICVAAGAYMNDENENPN